MESFQIKRTTRYVLCNSVRAVKAALLPKSRPMLWLLQPSESKS